MDDFGAVWEGAVNQLGPESLKTFLAAADEPVAFGSAGGGRRLGAVLAVFLSAPQGGGLAVLLTKRAAHLEAHPGQIAFPGGAVEPGDADFLAAALRETWEELGLAAEELEILGRRPLQPVLDRWLIHPHLAWWKAPRALRPDPAEVAAVIVTPLAELACQHQRGSWREKDPNLASRYLVAGGEVLWGATARILARLLDRLCP